jgi:hypothetical protein
MSARRSSVSGSSPVGWEQRDPNARREGQPNAFDRERLVERASQHRCRRERAGGVVHRQQHRELVAAEPRNGV